MPNQVIIAPTGSFSQRDKSSLLKNGFLVIETDNYAQIRLLSDPSFMEMNGITLSLLEGLALGNGISDAKERFIKSLYEKLKVNNTNPSGTK